MGENKNHHRYSVIGMNPLALRVRELVEGGILSEWEAALCLSQDDETIGMEYANGYAADRVERLMSR